MVVSFQMRFVCLNLSSVDDFYINGEDLVIIETTNGLNNPELCVFISGTCTYAHTVCCFRGLESGIGAAWLGSGYIHDGPTVRRRPSEHSCPEGRERSVAVLSLERLELSAR